MPAHTCRQGMTLGSKLVLLTLHFPRLRLLWSRSLHATADLFRTLKEGREEPDAVLAASVGAHQGISLYLHAGRDKPHPLLAPSVFAC